jgi:cytochrome b6-f complex iron-sulfur subunit
MADPVEGSTPAQPPVKTGAVPAAKAPAAKPAAKPKESADAPDPMRRRVIWGMIYGYLGINLLMFLRFFFPRALYEPNTIFNIGYPADFSIGIDQRYLMTNRAWVVREPDRIFVIFARCTHLGCTPEWKPAENKFKCPCHGSGYDSEGVNFEGPAPRPMDRCKISIDPTGKILVDTNKLYQWPKGGSDEFELADAYIKL